MMMFSIKNIPEARARYETHDWTHRDSPVIGFIRNEELKMKSDWRESSVECSFKFPRESSSVYINIDGNNILLPLKLSHIAFAIENSRAILHLEDDWNHFDANKIDNRTWVLASMFLVKYSKYIFDNFSTVIKAPEINPCINGSIDLMWRTKNARLLVNIKPFGSQIFASCYGDLYNDRQPIKTPIQDQSIIEHLAFWMKNLL